MSFQLKSAAAIAAVVLVSSSAFADRIAPVDNSIKGTVATLSPIQASSGTSQTSGLEAVLYNSGGFESFADGALGGQNSFIADFATPTFTVGAGTGLSGTKGVTVGAPTATNWVYPVLGYTPLAGEVVSVNIDIAASDPALSTTDPFGYLLDCYSPAARIGRVGLVYSANTILPAVTFNNAGTVGTYLLGSTPLTAGAFYNFELRFNFATKTFDVYSNNSLVAPNLAFSTLTPATSTSFNDGDLQVSGAAGAATTGVFDNYLVQTLAIPEPATLGLLAGVGLVALRRKSR